MLTHHTLMHPCTQTQTQTHTHKHTEKHMINSKHTIPSYTNLPLFVLGHKCGLPVLGRCHSSLLHPILLGLDISLCKGIVLQGKEKIQTNTNQYKPHDKLMNHINGIERKTQIIRRFSGIICDVQCCVVAYTKPYKAWNHSGIAHIIQRVLPAPWFDSTHLCLDLQSLLLLPLL